MGHDERCIDIPEHAALHLLPSSMMRSQPMPDHPRVLLVADLNYYAKGYARWQALKRLGAQVEAISHTPVGDNEDGTPGYSLLFRIAWKIGIHMDTENINVSMPERVRAIEPDVIWIEKGNMVRPGTMAALRMICPNAIIASYSEDDMYNPINRSLAYQRGLKHYHIVFTSKSFNAEKEELPSLGANVCQFVDKAFDREQHRPIEITEAEREAYGSDVGFIGTYAPERGTDLLFLAENSLSVRVWGNGWEAFSGKHPNLRVERRALVNRPDDLRYTKGILATKINLGFLRKINRDLQTDRSIEIPACGGFLLAEFSSEHDRLFANGKEAVFYNGQQDLLDKAQRYLSDDTLRHSVAKAGRKRCLASDYSHDGRMAFMLEAALRQQL